LLTAAPTCWWVAHTVSGPDIVVFPNLEELSHAAAVLFAQLACCRTGEGEPFFAALSGGTTPRRLCELLAGAPYAREIPWRNVHLFQVDERCVPPDHPDSNYRMLRERLLDRVPLPEANFHRMAAEEADLARVACQYAEELAQVLHPEPGQVARLDLVYLGMGADGHTASLFPGSPALEEKTAWVRANPAEKLGAWRITLTPRVLNAAAQVVFLVSGAEKAETLWRVLKGPLLPKLLPAQGVRLVSGRVSWYVDQAAARLL
jgi:6-phosphogluconolactonase